MSGQEFQFPDDATLMSTTDTESHITYANDAFVSASGFSREEVAGAEAFYRDVREGKAGDRRFHKGIVVRTGVMASRSLLQTLPVRWRIRWPLIAMVPAITASAWALGVSGGALGGIAAVTMVSAALTSLWLQMQITTPLEQVLAQGLRIASGDKPRNLRLDRTDEIGMVMRTIHQLGLMLRWVIDDVSDQVLTVKSSTGEIAQGNTDLSARTEQAAASVEETASSMEQMTASVKSNADTASQAERLSGSASEAAARGGVAVSEVVHTMNDITASSKKIADIIGVIDGIAFQTNILALNDIVAQVKRVSDLIAEISSATAEQSSGIGQVSEAVGHLDQITQQNAGLVEQSAAASESLNQQTTLLAQAVSVFR